MYLYIGDKIWYHTFHTAISFFHFICQNVCNIISYI